MNEIGEKFSLKTQKTIEKCDKVQCNFSVGFSLISFKKYSQKVFRKIATPC